MGMQPPPMHVAWYQKHKNWSYSLVRQGEQCWIKNDITLSNISQILQEALIGATVLNFGTACEISLV